MEAEIKQVIEHNLQTMNDEDLSGYMDTIAKDANPEGYIQTENAMKQYFSEYDLKATIKSFNIVSVSEEYAVVEVEQDTINNNSAPFKDNRMLAEHTLVKEDNQWKIKSTILKSRKQIDKSGEVIGDL
ncbi:hypothetical protein [Shimazuella kribbensis]|uniref:hypothetical protein n=1 Tax=Shimazuella kribbensis TaxID=139808 RepID=UPI0014712715|nr:hypothetical protein [Shimazuella kribbensis]